MARRARKGKAKGRPRRIEVVAERDGSELCLRCGMCCDGTLFSTISLDEAEREHVASLGLVVRERPDSSPVSPQPCPAFVDGCCALYERERPAACGTYRCAVLVGYVNGEQRRDDALAVLGLVRSLARELEVEMGLAAGQFTRSALGEYLEAHEPWNAPERHARLLIALDRFTLLGLRYFGYQAEPAEQRAADAGRRLARSDRPRTISGAVDGYPGEPGGAR